VNDFLGDESLLRLLEQLATRDEEAGAEARRLLQLLQHVETN
jgi:hypothetical protein